MKRTHLLSMLFMAGLALTGRAQTVNINCGGIAFTATDGTQWLADEYYNLGELVYTGNSIVGVAAQDMNLYRSGRAGLYTDFSYNVPVPNGSYMVTLGFAEVQYSAPGQRVFNVVLNGTTVLSNFDILTHVAPLNPYQQQFPVTVTNGSVQIAFNGVTGRGLVNAIQIAPGSGSSGSSSPPATPALSVSSTSLSFSATAGGSNPSAQNVSIVNAGAGTLTWSATSNASWLTVSPSSGTGAGSVAVQPNLSGLSVGTYTGSVTISASGASGSPATVAVTFTVAADPPPPSSSININCGGVAMTTSDGTKWVADEDYADGELYYVGSSIAGTAAADSYLYRTARAGLWTDFSYSIPVPDGSYVVTLRFAELEYSAKGQRVFNVVLNGTTVLSNFDILASVAPLTPLVQAFPVTVTNGAVQLDFNGVVNRGIVNAIQVAPVSSGTTIPPSIVLGGASLNFSATAGGSNPTAQAVTVNNSGGGTLNWTASSNQSWLTVSPASGTAPSSISVQPNISGLAAGSYSGTVTIGASGASNSPQTVSVSLTVSASTPPALTLSSKSLSFTATAGGSNPSPQTVNVSNSGSGTLSWATSSNQSWLTVSPASGTNAGTLTIGATVGSLAANTYSGTVTVNGGTAGTQTVTVSFAVSAAVTSSTGSSGSSPTLPATSGNNWYVSTTGSPSGNGTTSSPWDINTALAQPASVKPGDTIWIMGGTYGDGTVNTIIHSTLVGTPTSPIIVRAYPGQRATINNWLQVGCCDQANNPANGSYTWFWGLEFASYNTNRTSGTSGPPEWAAMYNHDGADSWGDGTKFINCIFHDTAGGISVWETNNSELNGNIIYNVGGYGTDRGHGHDLYLQNAAPSLLTITDNIGFNNFDEGVQAYGSSTAYVQNMVFTGNVVFNSGLLYGNLVDNFTIGGGSSNGGADQITMTNNYTYDTPGRNLGQNELCYLWTPYCGTATITNNYFIGGYQAVDLERWNNLTFQNNTMMVASGSQQSWMLYAPGQNPASYAYNNNTYYGPGLFWWFANCTGAWPCSYSVISTSQWQGYGLDKSSTFNSGAPTAMWTFVRPNQYEPGRANIVIYNWPLSSSVSVDLSKSGISVGDKYQIRDAENWYNGPVVSGTYTGSPVSIPMTGLPVVQPVGSVPYPPSHTAPQFGVFVLLSGTALANTY